MAESRNKNRNRLHFSCTHFDKGRKRCCRCRRFFRMTPEEGKDNQDDTQNSHYFFSSSCGLDMLPVAKAIWMREAKKSFWDCMNFARASDKNASALNTSMIVFTPCLYRAKMESNCFWAASRYFMLLL